MDEIACVTGQDPLDVRKRNLYRPGADTTPYGQQVDQLVLAPMLEQLEVLLLIYQKLQLKLVCILLLQ